MAKPSVGQSFHVKLAPWPPYTPCHGLPWSRCHTRTISYRLRGGVRSGWTTNSGDALIAREMKAGQVRVLVSFLQHPQDALAAVAEPSAVRCSSFASQGVPYDGD